MKNPIKQILAHYGLSVLRSKRLSQLIAAQELLPEDRGTGEDYVPAAKLGNAGFSLNLERQVLFLKKLSDVRFQELFRSLRADPNINVGFAGRDYRPLGLIHNGFYPTPDAELYAAFIADYQPTRIIEVGSGYSTVIANHALRHLGYTCQIHVIDPVPRCDVTHYASKIEHKRVQDSSLNNGSQISNAERTILFIDSSHVTKLGGDIPFLFCRFLPLLPSGFLVHVHDIFTPYDYPENYGCRFYTEQYALQALLANSKKFSVLFSTHAMSRERPREMQATFGNQVGVDPLFFGASFWMQSA